jgi:transcription elongation factor Elf1
MCGVFLYLWLGLVVFIIIGMFIWAPRCPRCGRKSLIVEKSNLPFTVATATEIRFARCKFCGAKSQLFPVGDWQLVDAGSSYQICKSRAEADGKVKPKD